MLKEKIISFAVASTDSYTAEEIEQSQFTKLHLRIYSDAVNDHGYICPKKTLKKYAKTIAGKPILAWYNKLGDSGKGDFGGHEDDVFAREIAVGFIPEHPDITYEKEDGVLYLCVDGYIWNLYYEEIVQVFHNAGGEKGVSSEMFVIDSEVKELDDGRVVEEILQYSFTGVTLLGKTDSKGVKIKPAVDGCNGKIVKFSVEDEFEKAKIEFEKTLYSINQESAESGSFLINKKEDAMENQVSVDTTLTETVDNATQVISTDVRVSTSTATYDDNHNFVEETYETHSASTTKIVEIPEEEAVVENAIEETVSTEEESCIATNSEEITEESTVVENSTEEVESAPTIDPAVFAALEQKCSALEEELTTVKSECAALVLKCSQLEEYKTNKENEIMRNSIDCALNNVSHVLNSDQMDEWRTESMKCSAANVDEFINKLKAFAFDIQEKNGVAKKETLRNSIPKTIETSTGDFWADIERKYK